MIYTSRYQNSELATGRYTVVGITRGKPKFPLKYELAGNIMEIAPPGYLWNENDQKRFTDGYFRYMDRTGAGAIESILGSYRRMGRDIVLCCFEDVRKPGEWCHRQIFAKWWYNRTEEFMKELYDPSPDPRLQIRPSAQPVLEQLSLF